MSEQTIWRCEKDHLDDFHLSIDGVPERCSRCGGEVREYLPLSDPALRDVLDGLKRLEVLGTIRGTETLRAFQALTRKYPSLGGSDG